MGTYCVLNMFLAIVLQNFEEDQKRMIEENITKSREQIKAGGPKKKGLVSRMSTMLASHSSIKNIATDDLPPENVRTKCLKGVYWKSVKRCCACRTVDIDPENADENELELMSPIPQCNPLSSVPCSPTRKALAKTLKAVKKAISPPECFRADQEDGEIQEDFKLERTKTESSNSSTLETQLGEPIMHSIVPKKDGTSSKKRWMKIQNKVKIENSEKNDPKLADIATQVLRPFMTRNLGQLCSSDEEVSDIVIENNKLENSQGQLTQKTPTDHMLRNNRFYKLLANIVYSTIFQRLIMFLIIFSTIVLMFDSNEEPNPRLKTFLLACDTLFTICFTIEASLKILVMGFWGAPNAYLNDYWNVLDFVVVVNSLLAKIFREALEEVSAFKALRAFRPLRLLSRNEGMRVVIHALFRSLPSLFHVLGVIAIVWMIFAIIFVQLFSGKLSACFVDEARSRLADVPSTYDTDGILDKENCIANGHVWIPAMRPHFDNFMSSFLTLFSIATLEGWIPILYGCMHAASTPGMSLSSNNTSMRIGAMLIFIVYILFGSFISISLFVGVVFDNFVKLRDEEMGLGMLSDHQKTWVQSQIMVLAAAPDRVPLPPGFSSRVRPKTMKSILGTLQVVKKKKKHWRFRFYKLTRSENFEKAIMGVIMMNVIIMMFESKSLQDNSTMIMIFMVIDIIFTIIFTFEMIIKMLGLGIKQYFKDHWNQFDFIVVFGAWINLSLTHFAKHLNVGFDLTILRIVRLFRVSRLIRLVKSLQRLKALLRTLIISLPSLGNVGTLLLLMYIVFAIIGVAFFSKIPQSAASECITPQMNFETFSTAFLTLFVLSTGENWDCVMYDYCNVGGNFFLRWGCYGYFILFVLVVSFITLNLFIAIIIDNFSLVAVAADEDEDENNVIGFDIQGKLTEEMVANFTDAWSVLDPTASKYIGHQDFPKLLRLLDPPLGAGEFATVKDVWMIIHDLTIPLHEDDNIHFSETLYALTERICGTSLPKNTKIFQDLQRQLTHKLPQYGTTLQISVNVILAVVKCQKLWRQKIKDRKEALKRKTIANLVCTKNMQLAKKSVGIMKKKMKMKKNNMNSLTTPFSHILQKRLEKARSSVENGQCEFDNPPNSVKISRERFSSSYSAPTSPLQRDVTRSRSSIHASSEKTPPENLTKKSLLHKVLKKPKDALICVESKDKLTSVKGEDKLIPVPPPSNLPGHLSDFKPNPPEESNQHSLKSPRKQKLVKNSSITKVEQILTKAPQASNKRSLPPPKQLSPTTNEINDSKSNIRKIHTKGATVVRNSNLRVSSPHIQSVITSHPAIDPISLNPSSSPVSDQRVIQHVHIHNHIYTKSPTNASEAVRKSDPQSVKNPIQQVSIITFEEVNHAENEEFSNP